MTAQGVVELLSRVTESDDVLPVLVRVSEPEVVLSVLLKTSHSNLATANCDQRIIKTNITNKINKEF